MLSFYAFAALAASFIPATSACTSYAASTVVPFSPNKNVTSVDQSAAGNGTYYLADRTNNVVHVINISSATEVAAIKGFAGAVNTGGKLNTSISGPNGLLLLPNRNELYVGDTNGTVRVVSTTSNTIVANISTGSPTRADEMAYDSKSGIVVITNPNETPPYVSVVSAVNRTTMGHIIFNNASGLEQPVFDATTGTFYVSVPSTGANPGGEVAALNINSMSIGSVTALQAIEPAGIVLGPSRHLFVSASQDQILKYNQSRSVVLDLATGSVIANISGVAGVDQVAYDSNANLYFASAYQDLAPANAAGSPKPILAIIDAASNQLLQTIPTDNVTAHSIAVDTVTNKMMIPLKSAGGVQIFDLQMTATACVNATNSTVYANASSTSSSAPVATATTNGSPQYGLSALTVVLAAVVFAWQLGGI